MFGVNIAESVKELINTKEPMVALESALITHGFSYPDNLVITREMVNTVTDEGAHAVVIGVYHGDLVVGMSDRQIEEISQDTEAVKVSLRDLALSPLREKNGGTTVAATAWLASIVGIRVFATGGIGGVHRRHPEDVSADLAAIASSPVIIVCAGAKSILDLPNTLEYLETFGIPVVGWCTDTFPAFYSRSSGLPVDITVHTAQQVAEIYQNQRVLDLSQGILVAVPVPEEYAIPESEIEPMIMKAVIEAEEKKIDGKALTPFLLSRLVELSESRTRKANESLLVNNAKIASRIARVMV